MRQTLLATSQDATELTERDIETWWRTRGAISTGPHLRRRWGWWVQSPYRTCRLHLHLRRQHQSRRRQRHRCRPQPRPPRRLRRVAWWAKTTAAAAAAETAAAAAAARTATAARRAGRRNGRTDFHLTHPTPGCRRKERRTRPTPGCWAAPVATARQKLGSIHHAVGVSLKKRGLASVLKHVLSEFCLALRQCRGRKTMGSTHRAGGL